MKKNIAKLVMFCSLFAIFSASVFAENAIVTSIKGKVEVNHGNDTWVALAVGDKISEADTVSTGFQSEVKIKYNGSVMLLGALTRVTLKQLSSTASTDKVDVFLNTGAVRSKVTHTDDKKVNYQVRGAVAVASVRGTEFVARADGSVECYSGAVAVYPAKLYVEETQEEEASLIEQEEAEEEGTEETAKEEAPAEESSSEQEESAGSDNTAAESNENSNSSENDSNASAESNTGSSDQKSDSQPPATATTPANQINSDAPAGAIVVGQNQSAKVSSTGSMQKPVEMSSKKVNKVKTVVATAAEKETVSTSISTNTETIKPVETPKGSISVKIEFEE